MQLLLALLLLEIGSQPVPPDPEIISCDKPAVDDARPYTLCLADAEFARAEVALQRQLKITLARVESDSGKIAAERLRNEQLEWLKRRDSECETLAGLSPTTQAGRNQMSCRAQRTKARTDQLKVLAGRKARRANLSGTALELFSQLAELGALARACDERSPDIVTSQWVRRFQRRMQLVEARLEKVYGEAAVRSASEISVHGCFGGTSRSHRRAFQAVLAKVEAQLSL